MTAESLFDAYKCPAPLSSRNALCVTVNCKPSRIGLLESKRYHVFIEDYDRTERLSECGSRDDHRTDQQSTKKTTQSLRSARFIHPAIHECSPSVGVTWRESAPTPPVRDCNTRPRARPARMLDPHHIITTAGRRRSNKRAKVRAVEQPVGFPSAVATWNEGRQQGVDPQTALARSV